MFHKIVKINQYSSTSTKLIEKKPLKINQSKIQWVKRVILFLVLYMDVPSIANSFKRFRLSASATYAYCIDQLVG